MDVEVPPAGTVITGKNAAGKTSVLRAITAALAAQGVGPEAVRLGADASEILVDIDALRVRRRIARSGSTSLTVKEGENTWTRPQTRLTELLGTAPIDALALFLAEPKDRRRLLLEAVPIAASPEDVDRWLGPGAAQALSPEDLAGHGLEVVDRLRKRFFERRTGANRDLKAAREDSEVARDIAIKAGADGDLLAIEVRAVEIEAAARAAAEREMVRLDAAAAGAGIAKLSLRSTRERIAEKRAAAAKMRDDLVPRVDEVKLGAARAQIAVGEAADKVQRLMADLAIAQRALEEAKSEAIRTDRLGIRLEEIATEANRMANEADADERAIVEPEAPAPAELEAARAAVAKAGIRLAVSRYRVAREAEGAASLAAGRLDEVVTKLSTVAPAELATRTGIIGLAINGDEVSLDGVAIDALSGAEQMRFAVEVARRANAKAKILVVDGLERLDGARGIEFVKMATADGWQLIATRVGDGGLEFNAIEVD
ncbi:MAG: hypothetical protein V4537_14375 [Pseudomonadota bacterium]